MKCYIIIIHTYIGRTNLCCCSSTAFVCTSAACGVFHFKAAYVRLPIFYLHIGGQWRKNLDCVGTHLHDIVLHVVPLWSHGAEVNSLLHSASLSDGALCSFLSLLSFLQLLLLQKFFLTSQNLFHPFFCIRFSKPRFHRNLIQLVSNGMIFESSLSFY